jgi:hypothetical protein
VRELQNSKTGERQLIIPVVMPSTFIREWKCAKTNPLTECDRYYCVKFLKEKED